MTSSNMTDEYKYAASILKIQSRALVGMVAGLTLNCAAVGAQFYASAGSKEIIEPNLDCMKTKVECVNEQRQSYKKQFDIFAKPAMITGSAILLLSAGASIGAGQIRRDVAKQNSVHTPS